MTNNAVVLIDSANLSGSFNAIKTSKRLPSTTKLDYLKLISAIAIGKELVSKRIYIETRHDQHESSHRKFLDFFRNNGFDVITKDVKTIRMENGSTRNKANFDVEITFDACSMIWRRECNEIILVSGDSDFAYLLDKAKEYDFRVTVVSSLNSISIELRQRADNVILLDDLDLSYLTF